MRSLFILFLLFISMQARSQTITTIAGNGYYSDNGDGGFSVESWIKSPTSITTDTPGNVYITDLWTSCIRKLDVYGYINRVAGNHTSGHSGDGGPATEAMLAYPMGIKADRKGNLYILDDQLTFGPAGTYTFAGAYIRKVDAAGIITTVAGNGLPGTGGDGGPALGAYFDFAQDIAIDPIGNIYVAAGGVIRKIDTSGIINTIAGTGTPGFSGDSGLAISAQLNYPSGLATDRKGNLFIADNGNVRIRKIDTAGIITTVAGDGMVTFSAPLVNDTPAVYTDIYPYKVTVDDTGNIYIVDSRSYIRKIDTFGIITTIAGNGMSGYSGDGGPATEAQIGSPYGVAVDKWGNIFIPDWDNNRIREIYITSPLSVSRPAPVQEALQIWPEPNNGLFNIFISSAIAEPATIIITDISGQQVMQLPTTTNKATAITLHAPAGTYCVSTIASGQTQSRVVILQ